MRFLLLNQFYPPDTAPTGWYLHGLGQELVRRGHQVKVLCSRRSYNGRDSFPSHENLNGVEVSRLPATGFGRTGSVGKMADYASFYFSLTTALLLDRSKPDMILSLTTPPYIGLLGKGAARKHGCRHAHWIMDLYPDVMFAQKMTPESGVIFRLLRKLTRLQLRGAEAIIALGPFMAEKVAAHTVGPNFAPRTLTSRPTWIPLWSDPELAPWPANKPNPLRAERGWGEHDSVFLYSGNMGLGHRFTEFLGAAAQLGASGPRWVFSGGGRRKQEIASFAKSHPGTRIEVLGHVPHHQLGSHLCAADVHLASLYAGWQGLMVPSKIQASFAVARPVIFVGPHDCETADWIHESGGGWVVHQDDLDGLLKAVKQALDPGERRRRGQAALAFSRRNFQMSENCSRIIGLLEGSIDGEKQKPDLQACRRSSESVAPDFSISAFQFFPTLRSKLCRFGN